MCILAPQRHTLHVLEKCLRIAYPDKTITSLIPQRQYDTALFSKFIAKYWDAIQYTPPMNVTATIRRELLARIPYMSYKNAATQQKTHDIAVKMMDDFEAQNQALILNWQNQVAMSVMTSQQMLDEIKKLLISFEIKRNAVAQALLSTKNAEAKRAADVENADFVLSTIHSAKGLEFDNVIIYYKNESESSIDEATKRMYYVAFTRAKKTEFIFAYDTMSRPKIQGDYERIIKDLTAKAQTTNATDDDDDDADSDSTTSVVTTADDVVVDTDAVVCETNDFNVENNEE